MRVETLTVGLFQENCYLAGDDRTGQGVIIDPGDEASRIIEAAEMTGWKFKMIINTHAHIDHVMAVFDIKKRLNVPFYLHQADEVLLANLPKQAAMFGLSVEDIPTVDAYLADGGKINAGGVEFSVIHTPGHTFGGVSLYVESEKVIFAGDTLFNGSIGRTDLYGGDFETLIHSIRSRLFVLPDEVVVYPGHGPVTAIGYEKRYNPFFNANDASFLA